MILGWLIYALWFGCFSTLADTTFVPLPVVTTDPHERETYGALLAILNKQDGALRSLLVPQATWNSLLGARGSAYYQYLLTPDETYTFYASQSTGNQADYAVNYANVDLAQQRYRFEGRLEYSNDRTARFFGLGPSSRKEDETNYTSREAVGLFTLGRRIIPDLMLSLTERVRYVTIDQGAVTSIPFLKDVFKGLPGEEGGLVWAHRLALTYDTRDSRATPSRGSFGEVFVEGATRTLGSQASFVRYGLEGRLWWPLFDARLVTVTRGLFGWVEGSALPFFELSALGGDTTLRGFGDHRFLDKGRILLNIEERIRTFTFTYEDIHTTLELALFVEAGQVFHTLTELSTKNVQTVSGVGLRLVVTSKLVAKIDIGFGSEGIAIFTGLDYPF